MPNNLKIFEEISSIKAMSQDTVRRKYLKQLSEYTKRDTVIYASAFYSSRGKAYPAQVVMITQDDVHGFMSALNGLKGKELDLIISSPGGSMEAAEQIVNYLRAKYDHIRAIIPMNAMSAGTMLACACDEIIMGKHSALGPIDPQITIPQANGQLFTAPAQAILDEFEQAKNEVTLNPRAAVLWAQKIMSYPNGLLKMCDANLKLAVQKVEEWLGLYMFKGADAAKANTIASWLGNASVHKSHGRPISALAAQNIGLVVSTLEADQTLQEHVLSLFHATTATFEMTNCSKFIENQNGQGHYPQIQIG